jgi:hypothetical protein
MNQQPNVWQQLNMLNQQPPPTPPVRTGVTAVGYPNLDKTLASPGSLAELYPTARSSIQNRDAISGRPAGQGRTKKLKKNLRKTRRRKSMRPRRK